MQPIISKFGLVPDAEDTRDFSRTAVFGSIAAEELPQGDFFVSDPIAIKDQNGYDFCAAYATAAVLEDHEHIELNGPFLNMAAHKRLADKTGDQEGYKKWGMSLRDQGLAACEIGALEEDLSPYKSQGDVGPRDDLANPKNWGENYLMLAGDHRQKTMFKVDGPHDMFDNMRSALQAGKLAGNSILTGVLWRNSWTYAPNGVIPVDYSPDEGGEPHAVKVFGQIFENNELRIVVQLSNGTDIGDKGLFYFPREIINKEFTYGAWQFSDMSKDEALNHIDHGIKVDDNRFYKLIVIILHFFTEKVGIRK